MAETATLSWLAADAGLPTLAGVPDLGGLSSDQADALGMLVGVVNEGDGGGRTGGGGEDNDAGPLRGRGRAS